MLQLMSEMISGLVPERGGGGGGYIREKQTHQFCHLHQTYIYLYLPIIQCMHYGKDGGRGTFLLKMIEM